MYCAFSKNLPEIIAFAVGLIATIGLGWLMVKRLLDCASKGMNESPPPGMSCALWDELKSIGDSGKYIGCLERILFFIVLFAQQPLLIGGILAFKVAAKWEAWKNIVQIPEQMPKGFCSEISYFSFKRQWGSKLLTRFLVGTFSNILIAFVGYGVYKLVLEFVSLYCWGL